MQDPICAMKILRRPKFRVPDRNLVRPETARGLAA